MIAPDREAWVIWSPEHRGWWKPAEHGYTELLELAGHYTLARAAEIWRQSRFEDTPMLIDAARALIAVLASSDGHLADVR